MAARLAGGMGVGMRPVGDGAGFAGGGRFALRGDIVFVAGRGGFEGGVFVGTVLAGVGRAGSGIVARFAVEIGVLVGGIVGLVVGVRRAEGVVARKGALGVLGFGVGIIGGFGAAGVAGIFAITRAGSRAVGIGSRARGGTVIAVARRQRTLGAGIGALGAGAVEVAAAVVGKRHGFAIGAATTTATTSAAAARTLVLAGTAVVVIITPARRRAAVGARGTIVTRAIGAGAIGARSVARTIAGGFFAITGPRQGFGFGIPFFVVLVFLFVVKIFGAGGWSVGRAGTRGRGNGLGFAGEKCARGQLDLAGGEAGELGGAGQAWCLDGGGRADDEGGDDVAGAEAQEVFDGVGDELGVDGGLGVEGERGFGGDFGIGPRVDGGGADAFVAQFVEELGGEVMEATFDGGGDGAFGGGAVAIPAEDEEMALFLAEPRESGACEGDGGEEADVEALGEGVDGGVEERDGSAPRGVNDKAYVPLAGQDVLDRESKGGRVGKVYGEGDEVVVRERIAGELGGESIHPAAHTDEAPGNGEARAGVGAGD
jgi:hypothetical protein